MQVYVQDVQGACVAVDGHVADVDNHGSDSWTDHLDLLGADLAVFFHDYLDRFGAQQIDLFGGGGFQDLFADVAEIGCHFEKQNPKNFSVWRRLPHTRAEFVVAIPPVEVDLLVFGGGSCIETSEKSDREMEAFHYWRGMINLIPRCEWIFGVVLCSGGTLALLFKTYNQIHADICTYRNI